MSDENDTLRDALGMVGDYLKAVEAERDRYRYALEKIADQESGVWGTIAARALRDVDQPSSEEQRNA